MRFNIYKEAKIGLCIIVFSMIAFVLFYFFASMFTSVGYKKYRSSAVYEKNLNGKASIIIDAGHGGEDPGACANGLIEKDLNYELSMMLNELFVSCGYNTVLTRKGDYLLYNQGEESKKKYYDLRNRVGIADSNPNSVFVSIHLNKFSAEYCKGLQVFYSSNTNSGKLLAENIQKDVCLLQKDNKRQIKCGNDTIYLLENIRIPAVLVECGFISNKEESDLLKKHEYKAALTLSVYCGVSDFMERCYEN